VAHNALTAADCEFELADAHDENRDRIWISVLETLAYLFCLRRVLSYLAPIRITSGKIEPAEYEAPVRKYRHNQSASREAAGLRLRAAVRPELLEVMVPWTDDGCDGAATWHSPILLPASQLKRRQRRTAMVCDYAF
jgi:hypothetical protein